MRTEQNRKKRIKRWVKNVVYKSVDANTELVLFGCVPMAKLLRDALADYGLNISVIIDNNMDKTGQECIGVKIHAPEEYLCPYRENIFILVCHEIYWKEMKKQAEELGYGRKQILIYHENPVPVDNTSIQADLCHIGYVIKGWAIYEKEIKDNDYLFLCPYKGTGDVYLAGGYFDEFVNNNGISNYTFLVTSNAGKKVAGLFGIKNIKVISNKQSDYLLKAYDFAGDLMRLKPLLYWGWRTKQYVIQRFCKNVHFDDMFKYDVYHLETESKRKAPVFRTSEEKVKNFFEKNGLCRGKTVIFAPYAGSFTSDIPFSFWEKLARIYLDAGYDVCTNSASADEKIIDGTKECFFDLSDAVPIAEAAGVFIGLRSGLCDVISTARCVKIVFYESGFNASQYDFFSLCKTGLCDDAIEIIYNGESDDELLKLTWENMRRSICHGLLSKSQ